MNDEIPKESSTDRYEAERKLIYDQLAALVHSHDSRLVFYSLLSYASMLGQKLIAVDVLNPEYAVNVMAQVAADMLQPVTEPVVVQYRDGSTVVGTQTGKKH